MQSTTGDSAPSSIKVARCAHIPVLLSGFSWSSFFGWRSTCLVLRSPRPSAGKSARRYSFELTCHTAHSIAATAVLAFTVWVVVAKLLNKPTWGLALVVAVSSRHCSGFSHSVHRTSRSLRASNRQSLGRAFTVSRCWHSSSRQYMASGAGGFFVAPKALLAVIVLFNLAALSFYTPAIPGPEQFLAGHPKIFAAVIGVLHIIVGLVAVEFFARSHWRSSAINGPTLRSSGTAQKRATP